MISTRLIRRAILSWQNWRQRKALHRACPILADLDRQERAYRRSHKKGAGSIAEQKRKAMTAVLSGKVA